MDNAQIWACHCDNLALLYLTITFHQMGISLRSLGINLEGMNLVEMAPGVSSVFIAVSCIFMLLSVVLSGTENFKKNFSPLFYFFFSNLLFHFFLLFCFPPVFSTCFTQFYQVSLKTEPGTFLNNFIV